MGQAGGLGGEGAGGECGCVDEIRHEGSAAVVAVEAEALCGCGCGTNGGPGEGPVPNLNQRPLGSDPSPGGCECLVGQGTAPGCCWWERQIENTGWRRACS